MGKKIARVFLLFLLFFLGLGAIFGGGAFIISPSGDLLGMPISALKGWPFHSFLLPGIVLFSILGVLPLVTCFALIKRPENKLAEVLNCYKDMYWGWTYSIYVAFGLIIWLQVEMTFMQIVHWAHSLYMGWAIAIIFFALMPQVRNRYKK